MSITSQYTQVGREDFVRGGRYWVSMSLFEPTNPLPPNVANRLNHTVENPAGSGKNVFLTRLEVSSNVGGQFPKIYRDPTGNLPTTAQKIFNANLSITSSPVTLIKADMTAQVSQSAGEYTGGSFIGYAGGPGSTLGGEFQVTFPPFFLPPGKTFGITTRYLNAVTLWLVAEWFEEDMTF